MRQEIAVHGVAIRAGSVRRFDRTWSTHYTVGLTRHEGHPEVVVVDVCCDCADRILVAATDVVRSGVRLAAGWGITVDGWDHLLVAVEDPTTLSGAQMLYRPMGGPPIPALQIVGSDANGEFPWESGIGEEVLLGRLPIPG